MLGSRPTHQIPVRRTGRWSVRALEKESSRLGRPLPRSVVWIPLVFAALVATAALGGVIFWLSEATARASAVAAEADIISSKAEVPGTGSAGL